MPKAVVTPEMVAHMNSVFAKGGFVPRRKGQRYAKDFMDLEFYNQQGEPWDRNNEFLKVEFLGTFQSGDRYPGTVTTYRAFAITRPDGSRFAGYSRDGDQYVVCQMSSFLAQ
jgi:hypothetical protein